MRRLLLTLLPCLLGCADRTVASATDDAGSSSADSGPTTATTDPTPTTTGATPTTTGEPSTTTGDTPTTVGDTSITSDTDAPDFCGPPGQPHNTGVVWQETLVAPKEGEGEVGDGVAVDAIGQIFFTTLTAEGTLVVINRAIDGLSGGTATTPDGGRDRAESLALASDGTVLYIATASAVLAVDPSHGDLVWEHPAGDVLKFHDVLADPQGGVFARGIAGIPNGVVALDADGGTRFTFTDDADPNHGHAGFARTAEGALILAFDVDVNDASANLRTRQYTTNTSDIAWQRFYDRDAGVVISAAATAPDGAIYLAGEESKSDIPDGIVTLYRLGADGALEWAVAVIANQKLFGEARQALLVLADGDVLIAPTELPQVLRFNAAGEQVGKTDISDDMVDYTGMAMQQDPCGAVAFVHTGFREVAPDEWHRALTVGRLWP